MDIKIAEIVELELKNMILGAEKLINAIDSEVWTNNGLKRLTAELKLNIQQYRLAKNKYLYESNSGATQDLEAQKTIALIAGQMFTGIFASIISSNPDRENTADEIGVLLTACLNRAKLLFINAGEVYTNGR